MSEDTRHWLKTAFWYCYSALMWACILMALVGFECVSWMKEHGH